MGKKVSNNGLYAPKPYNTHVYIMDDIDPNAPAKKVLGRQKLDSHTFKCDTIRELFNQFSDCEVHSVRFEARSKAKDVLLWWRNEIRNKSRSDLLIIFYHGRAGGEDSDYTWWA